MKVTITPSSRYAMNGYNVPSRLFLRAESELDRAKLALLFKDYATTNSGRDANGELEHVGIALQEPEE